MNWLKKIVSVLSSVVRSFDSALFHDVERAVRSSIHRSRLCLEALEDRTLLSVLYFVGNAKTPSDWSDNVWVNATGEKQGLKAPKPGDTLVFNGNSNNSIDDMANLSKGDGVTVNLEDTFGNTITLRTTLKIKEGFMKGGKIIGGAPIDPKYPSVAIISGGSFEWTLGTFENTKLTVDSDGKLRLMGKGGTDNPTLEALTKPFGTTFALSYGSPCLMEDCHGFCSHARRIL